MAVWAYLSSLEGLTDSQVAEAVRKQPALLLLYWSSETMQRKEAFFQEVLGLTLAQVLLSMPRCLTNSPVHLALRGGAPQLVGRQAGAWLQGSAFTTKR